MEVLNPTIVLHPYNWLVIALITIFWLLFLSVVFPQSSNGVATDGGE